MNKLYKITYEVFLNDTKLWDNCLLNSRLHYGEIPKLDSVKCTDFEEVWNERTICCSKKVTFFFKKRYILGNVDVWGSHIRISEKDFKSYQIIDSLEVYKDNNFSVKELARLLSATDFVNWCKDHGLNICPMK